MGHNRFLCHSHRDLRWIEADGNEFGGGADALEGRVKRIGGTAVRVDVVKANVVAAGDGAFVTRASVPPQGNSRIRSGAPSRDSGEGGGGEVLATTPCDNAECASLVIFR